MSRTFYCLQVQRCAQYRHMVKSTLRQALQIAADMSCCSVSKTCDGLQPGWRVQQHLWWSPMITFRQHCSEYLRR